jgi:hypothetical protein
VLHERRIRITTALGAGCGLASWAICAHGMGLEMLWSQSVLLVLINALMGFTIGISSLRIHWVTHGAAIGLLFGVVLALFTQSHGFGFWWAIVLGPVYGFMIELCATVFFHADVDAW